MILLLLKFSIALFARCRDAHFEQCCGYVVPVLSYELENVWARKVCIDPCEILRVLGITPSKGMHFLAPNRVDWFIIIWVPRSQWGLSACPSNQKIRMKKPRQKPNFSVLQWRDCLSDLCEIWQVIAYANFCFDRLRKVCWVTVENQRFLCSTYTVLNSMYRALLRVYVMCQSWPINAVQIEYNYCHWNPRRLY